MSGAQGQRSSCERAAGAVDPRPQRRDGRLPRPGLPVPPDRHRHPVLVQQPARSVQLHLAGLHDQKLDPRLRRSRRLLVCRSQPEDRHPVDDCSDDSRHAHRLRAGSSSLPRSHADEPPDLPADGDTRGRDGLVVAGAVHQPQRQPGIPDHPGGPHPVLHQLRRRDREGAYPRPRPAARAGGEGALRERVADLPPDHLPAGVPRHPGRVAARFLSVLRRLHHHQLQLRQHGHVPHVRMGRGATRHPATGQRHRLTDVLRRTGDHAAGDVLRPASGETVRLLVVGAGGVGAAVARIAARRDFLSAVVLADYNAARADVAVAGLDDRFSAAQVDAADERQVADLLRATGADAVLNACDPRFVMPIFRAALETGVTYLDMAMSLSRPHADRPHELTGLKLGDEQFDLAEEWERRGALALVGIGVEPGLSDVFAKYAAQELFASIDEIGVRDGANLVVDGYAFAPTFSIWTTIEECLNPPVIYERDRGWFTTEPFSEPEVFAFPEGIGPVECVNVEHEEVLLVPRWLDAGRVTFKYGLGEEFIQVLRTLHLLGLDSTEPVDVGGTRVSPRDLVAACLPDPAGLGDRMRGRTCAGTWVRGTGTDGRAREVYLYQVTDNEECMATWGVQAVVWQTAVNPLVALELLHSGSWKGSGVLGPEAFEPRPFLDLLPEYGAPWGLDERVPS